MCPAPALYTARLGYPAGGRGVSAAVGEAAARPRGRGSTLSCRAPRTRSAWTGRARGCLRNAGGGGCAVWAQAEPGREEVEVYQRTYYRPADFTDSRYDPAFSPILYPGQRVRARVTLDGEAQGAYMACALRAGWQWRRARVRRAGAPAKGRDARAGRWTSRRWRARAWSARGVCFERVEGRRAARLRGGDGLRGRAGLTRSTLRASARRSGTPCTGGSARMTRLSGIWALEDGALVGSGARAGRGVHGAMSPGATWR